MNKNRLRSIGAVMGWLILIILLSSLTDAILEASGIFPSVAEHQGNLMRT
jgi:hypothetical protein